VKKKPEVRSRSKSADGMSDHAASTEKKITNVKKASEEVVGAPCEEIEVTVATERERAVRSRKRRRSTTPKADPEPVSEESMLYRYDKGN
jgi:hypothetical protein